MDIIEKPELRVYADGFGTRKGYKRASLAVQKSNYAVKMYKNLGFKTVDENAEEYIMMCEL